MRRIAILAALTGAACTDSTLSIQLAVQGGSDATCPRSGTADPTCDDVPIACASMMLLRIVDPATPDAAFFSSCQQLRGGTGDLCGLASLDIPADQVPTNLPARTLEIQILVLPLVTDANGTPDCDGFVSQIHFTAAGPLESTSGIPIGGRAFYNPGDSITTIPLGCNDLDELNAPSCVGADLTTVTASVNEFDSQIGVSEDTASRLSVSVGEPQLSGTAYVLNPSATRPLEPSHASPPSWSAKVDLPFASAACLDVLEDGAQSTPTLACTPDVRGKTELDLVGARLSRERLAQIVGAIHASDPAFTLDHGLVVGIVLDDLRNPSGSVTVTAPTGGATVHYLSADGNSLTSGATSSNGIFISTDAPFPTTWAALSAQGFGGLVDGKVTIVVLQTNQMHL